jgi:hypothetical protein
MTMSTEEQKGFARLNTAWLAGERVDGFKFLHNSIAELVLEDGTRKKGWIVALTPADPEPVYTLEAHDGSGDIRCPESALRALEEP